jgi:hypothetical protein
MPYLQVSTSSLPKSSQMLRNCFADLRSNSRIRRVKCGEEKPDCLRCTSTGRNCDGYAPPAQTSGPSQRRRSSASQTLSPVEHPLEQSALNFFTASTAPRLSGSFSSEFWQKRVIEASRTEPSVRHGAIALGALHQDFVSRHERCRRNRDPSIQAFAFQQYTKAISHLHQLISTGSKQLDIALTACILFVCFDCFLGNHSSAIIHLKAGLKILEDIKLQNTPGNTTAHAKSAREWEEEFSLRLLAIGVQAASFENPNLPENQAALWTALKKAGRTTSPGLFSSLDEARYALDTITADIMADRTTVIRLNENDHLKSNVMESPVAALRSWEETLDKSIPEMATRSPPISSSSFQSGVTMLKVHGELLSIKIGLPETAEVKFDRLLDFCQSLTPAKTWYGYGYGPSHLSFSIDMGLIGPLYLTALKAPHMSAQMRAYDLLLQAPGREGLWDTDDAIRIASQAVGANPNPLATVTSAQHRSAAWSERFQRRGW